MCFTADNKQPGLPSCGIGVATGVLNKVKYLVTVFLLHSIYSLREQVACFGGLKFQKEQ